MNSVHEPGLNGDSETALSLKLGRKLSWVHKTPSWPSWAHRRAHAWPCRGRYGRVVAVAPGRVAGAGRRIVGAASIVSWAQAPCRSALCCAPGCRVLGWLCCIATQPSLSSSGLSQYNLFVLRYRFPHQPFSLLQYNTQYYDTVLQQPQILMSRYTWVLQYNPFQTYCNTIHSSKTTKSQYNNCIVCPTAHHCHGTIGVS